MPNGEGTIELIAKDCRYEGQIHNGNASGQGKFVNRKSRYTFEGQWENSIPKSGKASFDDGTTIEFDDFKSRVAKITYPDQKVYNGQINAESFAPDGNGVVKFPDGSWYNGTWKDGRMDGTGVFTWRVKDGDQEKEEKYDGEYFQGKKQGKGLFYFANGNVYEGSWKNGKM